MSRTLNVARMQLVNKQTFVWVPALVLVGALAVTLAVYAILRGSGFADDAPFYGGGAQAPLWYFAVIGAQALTLTFPFSQAMSVSRREFFAGTLLIAFITSAALALAFVAGGLVEEATGGWGMNGYFFKLDWLWAAGPVFAGLFYLALAMLFFVAGFAGATVYKRFGSVALTLVILGVMVMLVGALWLIGALDAWQTVFGGIAEAGPVGLTSATAALVVALAAVSFPVLRGATP